MKGLLIALLLNPLLALLWLSGPVVLALLIWRYMPDSKLKRILFTSWGQDSGPWMREPWQRKRRIKGRTRGELLPRK